MKAQELTLSLAYGRGPLGRPPRMELLLHLGGVLLDETAQACGTVVREGTTLREFPVGPGVLAELVRTLEAVGFPERLPAVREKMDTSDSWAAVLLTVRLGKEWRTLSLSLMCSGFEGPDAPALHRFFEVLLSAAGVTDDGIRHDLIGPG